MLIASQAQVGLEREFLSKRKFQGTKVREKRLEKKVQKSDKEEKKAAVKIRERKIQVGTL